MHKGFSNRWHGSRLPGKAH